MEVAYVSPSLAPLLGCTPEDFEGTGLLDMLHPEERALADEDFAVFLQMATLHGSATRCRMLHRTTQEYLVVEATTNVISSSAVFCTIVVASTPPNFVLPPVPHVPIQQSLYELFRVLQSRTLDPRDVSRCLVVFDALTLRVLLAWPQVATENVLCQPYNDVLNSTLYSLASSVDAPNVVRDIRTSQESMHPERATRCYNRHALSGNPNANIEAILEFTDECIFMVAQQFHATAAVQPPPDLMNARDNRFPLAGAVLLHQQQQQQAAAAAAAAAAASMQMTPNAPVPLVPLAPSGGEQMILPPPRKQCASCRREESPEWRKGPNGEKSLCNACGLRYARSISKMTPRKTDS